MAEIRKCPKCPMDTGGLGIAYTRMNLVYENEQGQLWQCSNPDCKHMDVVQ